MNNTISLELAKKIHEAAKEKGVELRQTEWVFCKCYAYTEDEEYTWVLNHWGDASRKVKKMNAYTTDELLEMLPETSVNGYIVLEKMKDGYLCEYKANFKRNHHETQARIPSEALGEMLYYLIENDLYPNNPKQ